MRNEARDQRQGHGDVAAEHVAERKVDDRAMLLVGERRVMVDHVRGRRQMLAVSDQCALRMTGRAGGVDDEGGLLRPHLLHLPLEPRWLGLLDRSEQLAIAPELWMPIGEHRRIVEHHDPAQRRQTLGERQYLVDVFLILGDEHDGAAVTHLILDLGGGSSGIDPIDDGAERLRGEVADHPLLAGISHDGDALSGREPQRDKCARRARDHGGVVAPAALRDRGRDAWSGMRRNRAPCAHARTTGAERRCARSASLSTGCVAVIPIERLSQQRSIAQRSRTFYSTNNALDNIRQLFGELVDEHPPRRAPAVPGRACGKPAAAGGAAPCLPASRRQGDRRRRVRAVFWTNASATRCTCRKRSVSRS